MNEIEGMTSLIAMGVVVGFLVALVMLLLPSGSVQEFNPLETQEPEGDGPPVGWLLIGGAVVMLLGAVFGIPG